jgi:hypothetical protein
MYFVLLCLSSLVNSIWCRIGYLLSFVLLCVGNLFYYFILFYRKLYVVWMLLNSCSVMFMSVSFTLFSNIMSSKYLK